MKIATVTGSRSDRNAIEGLTTALLHAGHEVVLFNVERATKNFGRSSTGAASGAMLLFQDQLLKRCDTELVFVHGDRHEVLAATLAANLAGLPVAHLGGGDVTTGSADDAFRHAITQLSHLHFPSTDAASRRIRQMGADLKHVHVVGCPGIDFIEHQERVGIEELWRATGMVYTGASHLDPFLLVVLHPNTIDRDQTHPEVTSLAAALGFPELAHVPAIIVGPNADDGADMIEQEWQLIAANRKRTVYHPRLEPRVFLSLMRHAAALVGNSSAGFYEAAHMGTVAVNIGNRQNGRQRTANIIQCSPSTDPDAIAGMIETALNVHHTVGRHNLRDDCYGDGKAGPRIADVLAHMKGHPSKLVTTKRFVEVAS